MILAASGTPVTAGLTLVGEATVSNSWYQDFTFTDTKSPQMPPGEPEKFDRVGLRMMSGSPLEGDGMTNLTPAMPLTFDVPIGVNRYDVVATLNDVQSLDFRLTFTGSINDSVSFALVSWDWKGGGYVASCWETASWDGTSRSWNIQDYSALLVANGGAVDLDFTPIPLPASILLGVFAVGLAGRKLHRFV